ncbi:MAG: 16S rRNA (adenine(1518)-N(6)/adenine(1519)-N(6))-dimethyltransferase RsmA [Rhizobiales bacterium]|nr:16S rRNA (adenine(1518)-N(6)/adenine(1519)-N(6))-dimethyltransferase RsmA [Hyphomicrobiales bacterium]NRB12989.1 16S rRNA (adenine(1518)-N(6)/adenine(1519)-N(6))-dimethyltransferase RsmA [Hyphomicrobiales bacterium]
MSEKLAMDGLPPLREVIAKHELAAKKSLGQNFLCDLNLTSRIARYAGALDGVTVLEIGPGPGGLTRALLFEGAKRVLAVEMDPRALPALKEISDHYDGKLDYILGDALKVDIASQLSGRVKVIANLPYNVATILLLNWLEHDPWPAWFESLTLMFQKEVAERIVARPNSKAYGRLSVICQWRCECQIAFNVDRANFMPPPKVTSSIVHLVPKPLAADAPSLKSLSAITLAAFNQRRKMLRASLKKTLPNAIEFLTALDIDPTLRADALGVDDYLRIAKKFEQLEA